MQRCECMQDRIRSRRVIVSALLLVLVCGFGSASGEKVKNEEATYGYGPKVYAAAAMSIRRPDLQHWNELLCYYFQTGFDHLILFFDEAGDPAIEKTREFGEERVTVIIRDADLEKQWTKGKLWEKLGAFIESEVMARQMLNEEVAVRLLREKDVGDVAAKWLLHLDGDEVLYMSKTNAKQHYSALTRDGFMQAVYLNHEVVPESIMKEGDSILESMTLFKMNIISFGHLESVQKARTEWEREKGPYAVGYWTGKAAVRVDGEYEPLPLEVTRFYLPVGQAKRAIFDDPCILHFLNPSAKFISDKYGMIHVGENQFDPASAKPLVLRSRYAMSDTDVGHAANGADLSTRWHVLTAGVLLPGKVLRYHKWLADTARKGKKALEQLFNRHFLVEKGSAEARRFMAAGLLQRFKKVKKLVRKARKEGCPAKVPLDKDVQNSTNPEDYRLGPYTQCLEFTKSEEVFCFTKAHCCQSIRASKGALKVPPEPY